MGLHRSGVCATLENRRQVHDGKKKKGRCGECKTKKHDGRIAGAYLIVLTWIIVFKMQLDFSEFAHYRHVNLIPFGGALVVNGRIDVSEIAAERGGFRTVWRVPLYVGRTRGLAEKSRAGFGL